MTCPHCEIRVHFDADGRCPACRKLASDPVTDEDRQRIEARKVAESAQRARLAEEHAIPLSVAHPDWRNVVLGVGIALVGLVWTALRLTNGDRARLPMALVAAGVSVAVLGGRTWRMR